MPGFRLHALVFVALAVWLGGLASAGSPRPDPPEHPFLRYRDPEDWTVRVRVQVSACLERVSTTVAEPLWRFDEARVFVPLVRACGTALIHDTPVGGRFLVGDQTVGDGFVPLTALVSGAPYAGWRATAVVGRQIAVEQTWSVRCWETEYDEQAALAVAWPLGPWPEEAARAFGPELGVEFSPVVDDERRPTGGRLPSRLPDVANPAELAAAWLGDRPAFARRPAALARFLAARVVEHVRVVDDARARSRSPVRDEGIDFFGAVEAARFGDGTPFDLAALYVAVCRAVGLPARLVIGLERPDGDVEPPGDDPVPNRFRAWAEFYLYDEPREAGGWIPVDLERLNDRGTPVPPGRPWKFFGSSGEFDELIPIAHHFHPPIPGVITHGPPTIWGWNALPGPPGCAFQHVDYSAASTPNRGGE